MADASKTLEVRALWDGTRLKAGTDESEAAIKGLEDQVSVSTESMESAFTEVGTRATTELGTTVPAAADQAAVGLSTRGSRFKSVGADLGTELATGAASGISGQEAAVNLGTSLSSLLAFAAKTGTGIAGAVGLGLGVAVISNMVKGVQQSRQDFVDAVNEGFQEIEVKARQSMADIREEILSTFTFREALEDLGGEEGMIGGLRKVEELVNATGADFNEVVDIIRGNVNPANRDTLRLLQGQSEETEKIQAGKAGAADVATEEAKAAREILDLSRNRRDVQKDQVDLGRAERDYLRESVNLNRQNKEELLAAAAAAERLGFALGNAVRQSNLFDIALGG